jgi:hypothetical protein
MCVYLALLCTEAELSARQDVDLLRVNALGPMWITQQLLPMLKREVSALTACC